ncbi:DUF1294 domain-containing protein [Paenibacillus campi]|uniref:DUF1294 domain-containing protein n=1 Tax=Paenibacillus campi TaxID=3106031 RepID=UPI002AFF6138|nr:MULTISPECIES: DUF1294 domain-containing protein [unclassified Paenibacillus]
MTIQIIGVWLIIINVVAYITMSLDKSRAVRGRSRERIPEKTLFTLAAIGGGAGIWIAMLTRRHKTKHRSFVLGVPALLVLNVLLYGYLFYRLLA